MAKLINPHTGKSVEAEGDNAKVLVAAGFKPVEEKKKPVRSKKSD